MRKYMITGIGIAAGVLLAYVGFFLRLNARQLAETRTYQGSGSGYTSTFDLYRQSVYQEVGLTLLIFGLALGLVAFYVLSKSLTESES